MLDEAIDKAFDIMLLLMVFALMAVITVGGGIGVWKLISVSACN